MYEWATGLVEQTGYLGVFLAMLLDNVFPPIPSEPLMMFAGAGAGEGSRLNIFLVILIGSVGASLGLALWYYVGKWIGQERLARFADKHGRFLTLSGEDIHKSDEWFQKHGWKAIVVARAIPAIRALIAIPAAVGKMPLWKVLVFAFAGSLVWDGAFAFIGYFIGERSSEITTYLNIAIYGLLAGVAIWYAYRVITFKK